MAKNYYAILGVLPSATPEEIRSAYRRRAKQYHPDHFGQDSAPFIRIQEAYSALSDPSSREFYDRRRTEPADSSETIPAREPEIIRPRRPPVEPLRSRPRGADLGTVSPLRSFRTARPSFEEMAAFLRSALDVRTQPKSGSARTFTMEVVLSPDQADRGGRVRILMPITSPCLTCGGSGETGFLPCRQCDGAGVVSAEIPLEVEFPPGIRDCYQVAIPLDRFGVHDILPILLFRISSEEPFEAF
jgi:hypothetical protein